MTAIPFVPIESRFPLWVDAKKTIDKHLPRRLRFTLNQTLASIDYEWQASIVAAFLCDVTNNDSVQVCEEDAFGMAHDLNCLLDDVTYHLSKRISLQDFSDFLYARSCDQTAFNMTSRLAEVDERKLLAGTPTSMQAIRHILGVEFHRGM